MVAELLGSSGRELVLGGLAAAPWVNAIGWGGQGVFSGRVLVQWFASERAHRPVAPRIFWQLSIAGALLMAGYSILRGEIVMLPSYVVTLLIYLRNLRIERHGAAAPRSSPVGLVLLGIAIAVVPYAFGLLDAQGRAWASVPWLVLAIVGQSLWIGRFVVQWRHAERHGKSEFPAAFWWLTIVGSSLLLAYSLHRGDHVFIFGFLMSWAAPARNLMLHHKHANAT
ncbi:MAG TPA: lipid-A-disaccharide synthase N-terminal domain-containing protein [Planctomycetota bacterium]|nr:lipid-A-disaccharide synthase N-terminal domain-containing protein [Planctomycetota bacterium]